uniref:RING-type domain-containing protein n=2 Tax=Caenorhabditis tropicalis TaxID=1561998 RepID=A0A1I7UFB4_9PELO
MRSRDKFVPNFIFLLIAFISTPFIILFDQLHIYPVCLSVSGVLLFTIILKLGLYIWDRKYDTSIRNNRHRDLRIFCVLVCIVAYVPYIGVSIYTTAYADSPMGKISLSLFFFTNCSILIFNIFFLRHCHVFRFILLTRSFPLFCYSFAGHLTVFLVIEAVKACLQELTHEIIHDITLFLFYYTLVLLPMTDVFLLVTMDKMILDEDYVRDEIRKNIIRSAGPECLICRRFYNKVSQTPRVLLECGHTLCMECALTFFTGSRVITCPFCRNVSDRNFATLYQLEENKRALRLALKTRKKDVVEEAEMVNIGSANLADA